MSHCRVLPLGEFNGMSSQSHVSRCRVLPLDEFTVMIPEPHATLLGAVAWRNQCHRATFKLQGVRIPSAILKIVCRHILFILCFLKCSLGFDERQLSCRLRLTSCLFKFLSRVSTLTRDIDVAILSVCLSVCP